MEESGQQWDFPNAWPPLQQLLVAGDVIYERHDLRGGGSLGFFDNSTKALLIKRVTIGGG